MARAIQTDRLRLSMHRDVRGRVWIDPIVADREWAANTDTSKLPARFHAGAMKSELANADGLTLPLTDFSVFDGAAIGASVENLIVLAWAPGGNADKAILLPMTRETAAEVAVALLRRVGAKVGIEEGAAV